MNITEPELKEFLYEMFMKGARVGQGYNQKTLDEFFETYYNILIIKGE